MEVIPRSELHVVVLLWIMVFLSFSQGENSAVCSDGSYQSQDGNNSCTPCKVCPKGSEVFAKCTNQSDTVCKSCDRGTFSGGGFKCEICSHCPPGTFVAGYCSLTSDTRCETCADGMYSSERSVRNCRRCSRCNRLKTVLKNCTKTENYECGDCIKGYFKHPNLPMCIKCSYCYPDNPGSTVIVSECLTKSDDPNMRCMPIVGVPLPVGFFGSDGSPSKQAATTTTAQSIFSSPKTYLSDNVLIPPHISIPVIIVCVALTVIVIVAVTIYKCRNICWKSKLHLAIFTTCAFGRRGKSVDENNRKRYSDSSNDIVMVHTGNIAPIDNRTSADIQTSDLGSSTGCERGKQTITEESGKVGQTMLKPTTLGINSSDDSCVVHVESTQTQRQRNKPTLPNFGIVGRTHNDQKPHHVNTIPTKRPNNDFLLSVTSASGAPHCAENDAFDDDEEASDSMAILLKLDATPLDSVSSDPVHNVDALQQLLNPETFMDPKPGKARVTNLQLANPPNLDPLKPPSVRESKEHGAGTDSEDSSQTSSRSAISSDYDSDVLVSNTLLDSGQAPAGCAGLRPGPTDGQTKKRKKKSRRQSDPRVQGLLGKTSSAKQLYSSIGTFSV